MEVPVRMAYWLVPSEPQLSELQKVVSELSARYDGPDFEPHATIYHGAYHVSDPVNDILETLRSFGEVELYTKKLDFDDKYTRSCVIEFEDSPLLLEMYEAVRKMIYAKENLVVVPHMSLFYGKLSLSDREEIAKELSLPKSVKFNVAKAIANRTKVTSREDVEYWNVRGSRTLLGDAKS